MSHKIDLKINTRYLFLTKDKKGHYIMSKGSILKEDITIVNIYALNMEKTMALDSSPLAWKIPWTEEPGRLQTMGSRRVRHD